MARYIDADALKHEMEKLYEHHLEMCNYSADGAVADCIEFLDNAPTVDAAPVVHGEWQYVPIEFDYHKDIRCSHCKTFVDRVSNYCPNCGAKMDGEKEEEDENADT